MQLRKEIFTLNNLKFLLQPKIALTLALGGVPNEGGFKDARLRVRNEFSAGFRLVPEYIRPLAALTGLSTGQIKKYYKDLKSNTRFYHHLNTNVLKYDCYAGIKVDLIPIYYILMRSLKPEIMIETGVANGISSAILLQAMEDNHIGKLYSIDIPGFITKPGATSGWIIPDNLRSRWRLFLGSSHKHLKPVCEVLGSIDLFISDSAHYYDNEMFEFSTVWPYLRKGGLMGIDDSTSCSALDDFASSVKRNPIKFPTVQYTMGLIRK